MTSWIDRRKQIVMKTANTIIVLKEKGFKCEGKIRENLVHEICLEWGCTRYKAEEYIWDAETRIGQIEKESQQHLD